MKALLIYPSEMSVYKGTRFEFKQTQECVAPLNVAVHAHQLGAATAPFEGKRILAE